MTVPDGLPTIDLVQAGRIRWSTASWSEKANYREITNETWSSIEDASEHSGWIDGDQYRIKIEIGDTLDEYFH